MVVNLKTLNVWVLRFFAAIKIILMSSPQNVQRTLLKAEPHLRKPSSKIILRIHLIQGISLVVNEIFDHNKSYKSPQLE